MLKEETRRRIMVALGKSIDDVVREHYRHRTAEDRVTAKIADRIERLDDTVIDEFQFRIIAHDVPSSGSRPWEKHIGADLYLSVSLGGPEGWNKGMLIQAKYDYNSDREALRSQCRKMRSFTSASYVWVYRSDGLTAVSARAFADSTAATVSTTGGRSAEGFVGRILDCYAGSKRFGVPVAADWRGALMRRLKELAEPPALFVRLEHIPTREGRRQEHLAEGQVPFAFPTTRARAVAEVTLNVISRMGLSGVEDLRKLVVQAEIVEQVRQALRLLQETLAEVVEPEPDVAEIVVKLVQQIAEAPPKYPRS